MGGLMWMIDYRIPFVAGAVLSVISLMAVQLISGQVSRAAAKKEAAVEAAESLQI